MAGGGGSICITMGGIASVPRTWSFKTAGPTVAVDGIWNTTWPLVAEVTGTRSSPICNVNASAAFRFVTVRMAVDPADMEGPPVAAFTTEALTIGCFGSEATI